MDTLIINCNCPGCKKPFTSYLQQSPNPVWISTCDTPDCRYSSVTLRDSQWTQLISDPAMQAQYQEQVLVSRMSPAELRARHAAKAGVK